MITRDQPLMQLYRCEFCTIRMAHSLVVKGAFTGDLRGRKYWGILLSVTWISPTDFMEILQAIAEINNWIESLGSPLSLAVCSGRTDTAHLFVKNGTFV